MPRVYVLGGANGAGRTTTARALMPDAIGGDEFVNADVIASDLSPFHPERVSMLAYAAAFPRRTHRCCGKAEGKTCRVE